MFDILKIKEQKRLFCWLLFWELQNLIFLLFRTFLLIQFRYVMFYTLASHLMLAGCVLLKKWKAGAAGSLCEIFYLGMISMNLFMYGISFGNLSARNINNIAYVVNYLYFFLLTAACTAIFRGRKGIFLGNAIVLVLGLLNYHVYHFRGNVLNLFDIYSIRTAWNVKGNYSLLVNGETILYTLGLLLSGIIFYTGYNLLKIQAVGYARWLVCIAAFVLVLSAHTEKFLEISHISAIYYEAGNNNGYYYNTLLKYLEVKRSMKNAPDGYDTDALYEKVGNSVQKAENNESEKPNVIVIMNESFADFSTIQKDIAFNETLTPNLDWIRRESVWGNVYVSVFGGNTANSEYEFLTNDSMVYYPQGSVPYSVYIRDELDALPEYFNQMGYFTCAVHPYKSSGWNRPSVYGYMNFQETYFEEYFQDSETIRDYVSDQGDYSKVLELLKEHEDPVFCFNITMQNHGGYEDTEEYGSEISIKGLDSDKVPESELYLTLIHESDRAVGDFLNQLKLFDEPTVVVFFGDHQPGIEDEFYEFLYEKDLSELSLEEKMEQYATPFFIWSNEEIPEKQIEKISLNYLSALMLDTMELPLTDYQYFLLNELYTEYPVVTGVGIIDKYGEVSERDMLDSELLLTYDQLIYNHVMDEDHTLKEIFTVNCSDD